MILTTLIDDCRDRLDDLNPPYLWADATLTRLLDEGVAEAVDRAFLIYDEATPAVCSIPVVAGTQAYALHGSILRVESAALASAPHDLRRIPDILDYDVAGSPWRSAVGTPDGFGILGSTLFLDRKPAANDTLTLRVRRLPLPAETMAVTGGAPAIPEEYHLDVTHWALYKAFSMKDADGRSSPDAGYHLGLFEARFGRKPSANNKRAMRAGQRHNHMYPARLGG